MSKQVEPKTLECADCGERRSNIWHVSSAYCKHCLGRNMVEVMPAVPPYDIADTAVPQHRDVRKF